MADRPGFLISGKLYPIPDNYTIGDSILIKLLTGLDMDEFAEGLQATDRRQDPRILAGMIGASVMHAHPRWGADRVARYVEQIDLSHFSFEGTNGEEEADDALPPFSDASEPASDDETANGSEEPASRSSGSPATG